MAAFPTVPFSLNQIHTDGGRSWKWDGSRWKRIYTVIASVVSDTPPPNPTAGMRWISPTLGRSFDYLGNAWVETTSGAPGTDGRPVEFQKNATHVQWRYVGDSAWTDLIALSEFASGVDGREIEFQKGTTHIEWRYVGEVTWTNLVALDDLKGADGNDGAPGADGADALWNFTGAYNPGQVYAIGDLATYAGETWYRKHANGGNVGDTPSENAFWTKIAQKGLPGADGREVEFQKSETHIQWRYVGDLTWTDLVALDDLKGADGINGNNGADGINGNNGADGINGNDGSDGRPVEFRKSETHIQWHYVGDFDTWTDLVALDDLKGADGNDGAGADFPAAPTTGTHVLAVIDGVVQWVGTHSC